MNVRSGLAFIHDTSLPAGDPGVANPSSFDLDRLRTVCLAFPEMTEKQAWGDPTWWIRNRIFAMQKGDYDGGRPSLWLKAPA